MDKSHIPSVSDAALARAAQTVVGKAVSAPFNEDPVIGPDLSRAISVMGSVVKRHGQLLQNTTAKALKASGRFEVLVDVAIPITDVANELVTARNSAEDLARINIRADSSAERIVVIDLVVIDPEVDWAGAYDFKRGNGPVDSRSRRPIEHDLTAVGLVLKNYLAKRGYPNIGRVSTGVIDYYGATGFSKGIKIGRDDLDNYFDVPVCASLDKVTLCLREALHAELPDLFATVLEAINRNGAKNGATLSSTSPAHDMSEAPDAVLDIMNARPSGPGPRRSPTTA